MKLHTAILLASFAALAGCKPESRTALVSPAGFSIEAPKTGAVAHKAIDFTLPAKNGATTHVNVDIQAWEKSFDEFVADSIKQVKELKNCTPEIVSETKGEDGSWTIEYKVTYKTAKPASGVVLHNGAKTVDSTPSEVTIYNYAKAIQRGTLMYLAGGSVIDKNYDTDFPAVKACVDSFKLTDPAPAEKTGDAK